MFLFLMLDRPVLVSVRCMHTALHMRLLMISQQVEIYLDLQVKGTEIAEHVRDRLEREKAEKERKQRDKQEAHLYITVNVATEADLREQIGTSIYFDLVDFDKVRAHAAYLSSAVVIAYIRAPDIVA